MILLKVYYCSIIALKNRHPFPAFQYSLLLFSMSTNGICLRLMSMEPNYLLLSFLAICLFMAWMF